MSKRKGECIYCGAVGPLTDDHVPPKNLFNRREGLVTVPSCRRCNGAAKLDDEYFRNSLIFHENVAGKPAASPAMDKALRSIFKPEAQGLRRSLLRRTRFSEAVTPGGIYHLRVTTDVDEQRVCNVAKRTARGLFWKHRERRLPDDYTVRAASMEAILRGPPRMAFMWREAMEVSKESANRIQGGGVFYYKHQFPEVNDPNVSSWLLVFFDSFFFVVVIGKGIRNP